jgi:hypothetical protein
MCITFFTLLKWQLLPKLIHVKKCSDRPGNLSNKHSVVDPLPRPVCHFCMLMTYGIVYANSHENYLKHLIKIANNKINSNFRSSWIRLISLVGVRYLASQVRLDYLAENLRLVKEITTFILADDECKVFEFIRQHSLQLRKKRCYRAWLID